MRLFQTCERFILWSKLLHITQVADNVQKKKKKNCIITKQISATIYLFIFFDTSIFEKRHVIHVLCSLW